MESVIKKNKYILKIAKFIYSNTILKYKNNKRNNNLLKHGREILIDFDKACKEANATYWLEFGTLLGAIRERNFIAHDLDIDVGMYLMDYDSKHAQIFKKHGFKKKKSYLIEDGVYGREETYSKNGVDIDIFYFTKTDDYMYCHAFSNKDGLSWAETVEQLGGLIVREFKFPIMNIATIEFLAHEFPVPNNFHEHLEANYGNYMVKDTGYSFTKAQNQKVLDSRIGILHKK